MLLVKLARDECVNDGFVVIGAIAHAIARALGSSNLPDAERKLFGMVNAGVQLCALNPLNPENMQPLSRQDYGAGIVPFAELVRWGRSTALYDFKSAFIRPEYRKDGASAEYDAPEVGAPETKEQRQDRRLAACDADGLKMDRTAQLRLPDGVGRVANSEGVTRQAFSTDVKAALRRRLDAIKDGSQVHCA